MVKIAVADIPHMKRMWDEKLNNESPENVSANCTEKKYWKCPDCGYAWTTSPKARYRGSGKCPCHQSNKVIRKGINDVLTIVKGLDAFLDDNNNFDEIYKQGIDSSLPVNLKCDECGRTWTTILKSQIKKDGNGGYIATGCPHYNTVKRKKSDVPFCSEVEDIMKFWDENNPFEPTKTKSNSTEKVHLICKNCGYDWTTEIRSHLRGTGKCKCCELHQVTRKGFTDVFSLVPESKRYFNFDKNKEIDIYSISLRNLEIPIDWQCPDCGREWTSPLASRIKGTKDNYTFIGCQACYLHSVERITPVSSDPKLIKYWDFKKNKELDVNLTSAYADIPANWRCKDCGYEWIANIRSRTNSNGACPFCEGKYKPIVTGVNDVLTLCPDLALIYDFDHNAKNGIDIYKEGAYSQTKAHFKCKKCGNEWESPFFQRIKKNVDGTYRLIDCSKCSHGLFRKTPYSVEFPLLAEMFKEEHNNIPLDSIRGEAAISHTYYYWDCLTCGEVFESTLNSMIGSYNTSTKGCPYCSRTKLRKGESFAELHPELMDEYDSENTIDPFTIFPNNPKSVGWVCKDCEHHWNATFALRHAGWGNCPVCNRTTVIPDKNSFAAVYPNYVKYWADSNERRADEVFSDSSEYHLWNCFHCKMEYRAPIQKVISGNDSCPYCDDRLVQPGYNSFADKHPDLLKEMDEIANYLLPKSPYEVLDTSDYKFWFTCKKNSKHKYLMSPRTRLLFQKRNREPCLYCRGHRRKLNHFVSYK